MSLKLTKKSSKKNLFEKLAHPFKRKPSKFLVFAIVGLFALTAVAMMNSNFLLKFLEPAKAAGNTCVWSGDVSSDWGDSSNWSSCPTVLGVPENGDDVVLPSVSNNYYLNNDLSGLSLNSLTIESLNSQPYSINGNTFSVGYGVTTTSGTYPVEFNTNVETCRTEGNGNITINFGITYTTGCNDFISYAFSGDINGTGTFVKNNQYDLELSANVDAVLVLDAGSITVPYGGSLNTTNQVTLNNGGTIFILDGPSSFANFPITINNGYFQHLTGASVEVYGLSFTDSINSRYHSWGGNTTIVSGSNLDLTNANYEMSWWGTTVNEQVTVLETTNGNTISGEFANWPSGTTRFFPNGSTTIEASIQYNSSTVVITLDGIVAGDCTWTGNNSGNWSDAGNWDGCSGAAPVDGKNLIFPSSAVTYNMNNDISGLDLAKISIEALNGDNYTVSGNDVIVAGNVEFLGSGNYNFTFDINTTSHGTSGLGKFAIGSNSIFTVGNGANYIFSGLIEGQGEFKKVGTGIQTFDNVTTGTSLTVISEGAFLELKGNTQIQGALYNNAGSGILLAQSANNIINNWQGNGGNINFYPVGIGNAVQITNNNFTSGDFGFDVNSTSDHGEVNFENGIDLSNNTVSMRFFNSFSINDTFTIITSQNGNITGEFSNLPTSGTLTGQGWGPSSITSNVEYTATYNSNSVVITITDIIPLTCSGNVSYSTSTGTVSSGINNYNPNSNCSWVIAPSNADSVTLNFTSLNTESSADIVRIYDGLTTNSALLGEFSGSSIPSSVTADSGAMLITFSSNGSVEDSGFSANWTSVEIPGPQITSINPSSGDIGGGTTVTVNGSNFETGQYQNIQSVGDTSYDGARGLVVDATGQYISGEFSGSITLGSTTLTSSGGTDIYIAKIDSNANYVWAVKAGGNGTDGFDRRQSMYLNDYDGTLMIAGFYQGSANFGGTTLTGGSGSNIFITKINKSTGAFIWAKSAGGDTAGVVYTGNAFPAQYGGSIDVDTSGNIYLSGKVDGSSPSFDAINITLDDSNSDAFVAKMDNNGNFIWVNNYGATQNPENQQAHGLVVDSSNNVYVTSGYAGSITIGGTTLTSQGTTNVSNVAVFKLDSDGNEIWAVSGGTVGSLVGANDLPYDLALDSSENLYLTGYHGGSVATFGSINLVGSAAGSTIYTSRINPSNGNFVWVSQMFTPGGVSSFGTSRDMHIDSNDKIWIGGTYTNVLTNGILSATGSGANAFFAQYDTSGNLIQLEGIGGTGGQLLVGGVGGNQVRAVYEYDGKLYIAGEYFDTVGIGGQTITSAGNQDGFYTTWVIGKTSVKIDNIEVIADFVSPTQLSFVTPSNTPGFKDVRVTNSDGRFFNLASSFEYIAPTIQNSNISSMVCNPSQTAINTTVNCTITTNVDISLLAGSVNVRIGTSGSVINCPVLGSGTTITCNNVPVGATVGLFASQYNASGSGTTYANGNNIDVIDGLNNLCGPTNQTTDCAILDLDVTGGTLTINTPALASLQGLTVATTETLTTGSVPDVTIQDLRGNYAGWSASCTITNFIGNNTNYVIPLLEDTTSKYAMTPSTIRLVQDGSGRLNDGTLIDNISTQPTSTFVSGVSNSFLIGGFATGGGQGWYEKDLGMELLIPAYVRTDNYNATMTCSVS